MHLPPLRSKQEDFTAGGSFEIDNWVPIRGPNDGRNVIKGFWLCLFGTMTVGAANWDGRLVPRLVSLLQVVTRSGNIRWSLNGDKSLVMSKYFCGSDAHSEHADVAIGAAQAVDLMLYIPMEKPMVKRGVDFALPADVFSKIVINFNSLAGAAGTGGAALSADALDFYILADVREENKAEFKAEDSVKSLNFQSQTEMTVKLNGPLHDACIFRDTGAAGGAAITAIGTVRCDELGIPPAKRTDLVRVFRKKRKLGNTGIATVGAERFKDPVVDGQLLPFIVADHETKAHAGKIVEQAKINLDAGVADLSLITREVLAKNAADYAAQVGMWGEPERVKTAGKTAREFGEQGKRARALLPWSTKLKDVDHAK